MSKINNQRYVQLISPEGKVLAQQIYTGQPLTYYQKKVWRVPSHHNVILVTETDLIHPSKFMQPVHKESDVFIYSLEDSIRNLPSEPSRTLAHMKLKGYHLESFDVKFSRLMSGWNAFVDEEWVGTSEY